MSISSKTDFPCIVCGKPTIFGKTHRECLEKTSLDGALCATDYEDDLVQKLIHVYKYKYVLGLGPPLAWLMARFIKQLQNHALPKSVLEKGLDPHHLIILKMLPRFLVPPSPIEGETPTSRLQGSGNPPLLIPIPLHPRRLRERGFNQAEILATHFAQYFNWPVSTKIFTRQRYTSAQMKITNQAHRSANIKDAFKCVSPDEVKDKTIILIDDVLTTGATTAEAAKVLKSAGAREVWVFCLAKD